MAVTPPVVPIPTHAAPPLSLSLPGGLSVAGVPTQIGATSLTQALALIGAAGPAMAPLGPVFAIIDAVLSVKDFAQAVPELIVNPGAVVEAVGKLISKITKLASLIPQLSVPLMIIGVIDAVIAFLNGLVEVMGAIAEQEEKIATAAAAAAALPTGPREALETIVAQATAALAVQRADVQTTLASAGPLLGIVNIFCGLIGLPGLEIEVDTASGSTADAVEALEAAVVVLETFRMTIPV